MELQPIEKHKKFLEQKSMLIRNALRKRAFKIDVELIPSGVRDLIYEGRMDHRAVTRFLDNYGQTEVIAEKRHNGDTEIEDVDHNLCIPINNNISNETFTMFKRIGS